MSRKNIAIILCIIICSGAGYSQDFYYGFWDYHDYYNSDDSNYVHTNFGRAKIGQFVSLAQENKENIIIHIYSRFCYDYYPNGGNERPDIEDESYWRNILEDIRSQIQYNNYENNCLGFLLCEEPMARGISYEKVWKDWQKDTFNFDMLYFVVSGDFTGTDHADIGMFYDYPHKDTNKIFIMPTNGESLNNYQIWFEKNDNQYNFEYIQYALSGDFTGDGLNDIAVFYDYPTGENRIDIFPSNGYGFGRDNGEYETWYHTLDDSINFDDIMFTVPGDFTGDDICDIAVFYKVPAVDSNKILVFTSNGYGFGRGNGEYEIWCTKHTSSFNFGQIRFVLAGDFTGDDKDDIAVLYDYPSSQKNRIFIFPSNGNSFDNYQNWFDKTYEDFYFGYVIKAVAGNANGDDYCDIALLYDYPNGRQRVFRYLARPDWSEGNKFEYAGHWRFDYRMQQDFNFEQVDFVLNDNFAEEQREDPYSWEYALDDFVYFYNCGSSSTARQKILGYISRYGIAFTQTERLERFADTVSNIFGPTKLNTVLYMKTSTAIPGLFANNLDWICCDPYPFTPTIEENDPSSYSFIQEAVENIADQHPGALVCLVGQSARDDALEELRHPTPTEAHWYYDIAKNPGCNANVKGIMWWKYDSSITYWGSCANDSLLDSQKQIGMRIFSLKQSGYDAMSAFNNGCKIVKNGAEIYVTYAVDTWPNRSIYISYSSDGGTTFEQVHTIQGGTITHPSIAIDDCGVPFIVWGKLYWSGRGNREEADWIRSYYCTYKHNDTWTTTEIYAQPLEIEYQFWSPIEDSIGTPSLSVSADSGYNAYKIKNQNTCIVRFLLDNPQVHTYENITESSSFEEYVSIGYDADDRIVIAEYNGDNVRLFYRTIGDTIWHSITLTSYSPYGSPALWVGNGIVRIASEGYDALQYGIVTIKLYWSSKTGDYIPQSTEFVSYSCDEPSYPEGYCCVPSEDVILWQDDDDIYYSRKNDGQWQIPDTISHMRELEEYSSYPQGIVYDYEDEDKLFVVWTEEIRDTFFITYNVINLSGGSRDMCAALQNYSMHTGNAYCISTINPNPIKGLMELIFFTPNQCKITVDLFDVTGRMVTRVLNSKLKPGENRYYIGTDDLAAGVYFIRFMTGDSKEVKKIIKIK